MCRKITDLARVRPGEPVLEIGPGTGALTRHLLAGGAQVHAVEVDRELFAALGVELGADPNLTLHNEDILRTRVRDLIPEGKVTVVGNLPYHITSDLLLWLIEQREAVPRAVVMMQREVAARITAEPGSREAGSLTLALHYRADLDRLIDVPPECFQPRPRVHSTVVALRFLEEPRVRPRDEALFFRTIRAAFGERRKTLANALAGGLALGRETAEEAARQAGLDPRIRGERLTLEEFRRLADALGEIAPPGAEPTE